jgi:DNA modification methylase
LPKTMTSHSDRLNEETTAPSSGVGDRVLPDIKPVTPVSSLDRSKLRHSSATFDVKHVARVVGFSTAFISRVCGPKAALSAADVLSLLDQDAYRETYVPRSTVLDELQTQRALETPAVRALEGDRRYELFAGNALDHIARLPPSSINCVVTSTPYWGLRIYRGSEAVRWADGDVCPFGHEQTPEGFARHTTQVLAALHQVLADDGSIWWNIMDTYNTRTQVRGNAAEALHAMKGNDKRGWGEHDVRRYSAGHAHLKDGEQCLIPAMIAERASRIGFFVKSVITWAKTSSLPEPQNSRVSRNLEYVLHLSKVRTPKFYREPYHTTPAELGGRNNGAESAKLSDVWVLPTTAGRDGHGAQFPTALPGRCISVSTDEGDVVLDPFVGAGNAGIAALQLNRRFIGIDISPEYLKTANQRLAATRTHSRLSTAVRLAKQGTLL